MAWGTGYVHECPHNYTDKGLCVESPCAALRRECASELVSDETGSPEAPCLKPEQTSG